MVKIKFDLSQVISAVFDYVLIAAASQSAVCNDSALLLSLNNAESTGLCICLCFGNTCF